MYSKCITCRNPTIRLCTTCKAHLFCSEKCEEEDHTLHRPLCKGLDTLNATRPSENHKLAILYPESSETPKLIWVKCNDSYPYAHLQTHLGLTNSKYNRVSTTYNGKVAPDHAITACYWNKNGSKYNESILKLTDRLVKRVWKGPCVILSEQGTAKDHRHFQDITLDDLLVPKLLFSLYNGQEQSLLMHETAMEEQAKCVMCNTSKSRPCPSCKSSLYCSVECQERDQPLHDLLCKDYSTFQTRFPRPDFDHKLALLLPEDSTTPQLVWLEFAQKVSELTNWEEPQVQNFLGKPPEVKVISRNGPFPIRHRLWINRRNASMDDGVSKHNRCVMAMMENGLASELRGPLVVYCRLSTEVADTFRDVTMGDLRVVANWCSGLGGS